MRPSPTPRHRAKRAQHVALALFTLAFAAGGVLSLVFGLDDARAVDLRTVDQPAGTGEQAAAEAVTPGDPDLERRLAEDVAAFVNSERRARSLPLLAPLDGRHARAANEVRLRDEDPGQGVLAAYDAEKAHGLFARLGTGTRTGEAVAGWVAAEDGEALLAPDATGIAVAAACQPGDRGGDLVLTVHVVTGGSVATSGDDLPITDERPGAGRGEACQFADLATGTQAEDRVVAPAALAAAGTLTIALVLLELQRRRLRADVPGYVRVDQDPPAGA
ncbi:MAG TPA: hypothetical protein VK906_11325 [Egicoccus sp.]|nr:hypothetical protein [Egicoccus sp.]HSK23762.1 hypothetical protein [Egicoccus sp.]